jgi:hypothetical protein
MPSVWMWPQAEINSNTVTLDDKILTDIEQYFSELYAPFTVVYFSRARVALAAISMAEKLSRPQLTFVQPFSSHCVLSAISLLSTPTTMSPQESSQQVIFHQWGSKTLTDSTVFQNPLIEDAVDSIITNNDPKELFPNNAPYCVLSLPKICQTSIGAIVVCQTKAHYEKLVNARTELCDPVENEISLLNTKQLKEVVLSANPRLVPTISSVDKLFECSVNQVRQNLSLIKDRFPSLAIPSGTGNRLPSNVMVQLSHADEDCLYSLTPFNVIEKQRTFFNYQTLKCEKVWLLPCHAQAMWS